MVILFVALSLSACGANEDVKTEREIRAEIEEEMEEEATEKAELRAELEAELRAELAAELAANDEQVEEPIVIEGDEIITTYAYKNLDGLDVSNLEEVVINAKDATVGNPENYIITSDDYEYKVAIFGEVTNVRVNYSSYIYDDYGVEIVVYDYLKDTVLIIKSNQMDGLDGFFVSFTDGRGTGGGFILNDDYMPDVDPIELKSGFTAIEKTPSSYVDYDMTDLINSIDMKVDEFDNSEMMQYAEKRLESGMDEDYYTYYMNDIIEGFDVRFETSDNILSHCYIVKTEQVYEDMPDEEKYNFMGIDFDMTVVRGEYNMVISDSIRLLVGGSTPDSLISSLVIYKED